MDKLAEEAFALGFSDYMEKVAGIGGSMKGVFNKVRTRMGGMVKKVKGPLGGGVMGKPKIKYKPKLNNRLTKAIESNRAINVTKAKSRQASIRALRHTGGRTFDDIRTTLAGRRNA